MCTILIPTLDETTAHSTGKLAQLTAGLETELVIIGGPKRGFTATVNDGLAQIDDGDVCILNDDITWFTHGWLDTLQRALYSEDSYAIAGPTGKSKTTPMCKGKMGESGIEIVNHLPFWCVLIKRATLDRWPRLDARFIHYASDSMYCDTVNRAGLKCVWARAVYLQHAGHGSGLIGEWAEQDLRLYHQELRR